MKAYEAKFSEEILKKLNELSQEWEKADTCCGFRKNKREAREEKRIFLAEKDGMIIGYLMGGTFDETPYFEIDEVYVAPEYKSCGVVGALHEMVEQSILPSGIELEPLSIRMENFRRILHFYLGEMGVESPNTRLFNRMG